MGKRKLICYLRLCAFSVFSGRAYQHIFWDAPYRAFFWDESLMTPLVEGLFNISYEEYITSLWYGISIDDGINMLIIVLGAYYGLCAIICLFATFLNKPIFKRILYVGAMSLVILAVLETKESFFRFNVLLEYTIQIGSPFLLLYALKRRFCRTIFNFWSKLVVALTFIGHGIYALDIIYPVPASFFEMTMNILSVSESIAKDYLYWAGVMDFAVAIIIFIPRVSYIALFYATFWGLATAFARVLNGLTYEISWLIIHQYLFATIYRISHGLMPMVILLYNWQTIKEGKLMRKKSDKVKKENQKIQY